MGIRTFAASLCMIMAGLPAPALADPLAELETMSRATADVPSGLAFARRQIGAGDLLGAMATLERLMISHPDAAEVRLLHASLFCRLDDRMGALIEFDMLRGRDFPDSLWSEATAPCNPTAGG